MSSVANMAKEDSLECFTFTWKIENFSMCPQRFGEYIQSPCFSVDTMNESKWKLNLFPKGSKDFNFVACYLESCNACEESVSYKLTLVADGDTSYKNSVVRERTFTPSNISWGFDSFISREELFTQSDKFLRNDILTLRCSMWKKDVTFGITDREAEKLIFRELYSNFFRDDMVRPGMRAGTNRTIINVRKKVLTWPIRNFSFLHVNRRLTISLATPLVDVPSFYLTVYISEGENAEKFLQVELRRKDCYKYAQVFLKCHVSILDPLDKSKYDTESSHLFISGSASESSYKIPSFVTLRKLRDDKYFASTGDVLKLKFEFSFSFSSDKHNTEDVSIITFADHHPNFNEPDPLVNELKSLYLNKEFTDVILQVEGQNFEAHKVILSANSSVFKSRFGHDLIFKENNLVLKEKIVIHIPDFSPTAVENMLSYIYTKVLGKMSFSDSIELYSLAERYTLLPMKTQCALVLGNSLSVSNFYEVLNLADSHDDKNLMEAVQNFIILNAREIFKSSEWKEYMKTDCTLAAEVMHKVLEKVMCL